MEWPAAAPLNAATAATVQGEVDDDGSSRCGGAVYGSALWDLRAGLLPRPLQDHAIAKVASEAQRCHVEGRIRTRAAEGSCGARRRKGRGRCAGDRVLTPFNTVCSGSDTTVFWIRVARRYLLPWAPARTRGARLERQVGEHCGAPGGGAVTEHRTLGSACGYIGGDCGKRTAHRAAGLLEATLESDGAVSRSLARALAKLERHHVFDCLTGDTVCAMSAMQWKKEVQLIFDANGHHRSHVCDST